MFSHYGFIAALLCIYLQCNLETQSLVITLPTWQRWCQRRLNLWAGAVLDLYDLRGSFQPWPLWLWGCVCSLVCKQVISKRMRVTRWARVPLWRSKFWFLLFLLIPTLRLYIILWSFSYSSAQDASLLPNCCFWIISSSEWSLAVSFSEINTPPPHEVEHTCKWTARGYSINLLQSLCNHVG